MVYLVRILCVLFVGVVAACAGKHTTANSGDDMYVVSSGMLAIDARTAANAGIIILDRAGNKATGVVTLRLGYSISVNGGNTAVIEPSPDALKVIDFNNDNRIDASDPAWQNMHLAVDYNGDGEIGSGEYALIGECGVDALVLDLKTGLAWSLHTNGDKKLVELPAGG